MLFQVLHIEELPESPLEASAAFFAKHLDDIRELAIDVATDCLAIIVPAAGPDHDDWRRSLVRDLAREFAPKRVNMIAGDQTASHEALLAYLRNAPGVTGQYLAAHE